MSDVETLVQASRLYYELGETQERIAEVLGVTRPQVSRLLKEARSEGIVEIKVIDIQSRSTEIADELCQHFGLRSAHVAPRMGGPNDMTRRMLGRIGCDVLRDYLRDGQLVGIGGGMTMSAVADAMAELPSRPSVTVLPLAGGGMTAPSRDPVRRIAEMLDGYSMELFAPGIVHDRRAREALMRSVNARNVINAWTQLDIAIFGIGTYLRTETWYGPEILAELDEAEVVGEILIHPFDIDGDFVQTRLRQLIIGFDPRELDDVPLTIAIAGGPDKVRAILGALRTGVIKVLVTDEKTARDVLELDAEAPSPADDAARTSRRGARSELDAAKPLATRRDGRSTRRSTRHPAVGRARAARTR